MFDVRHLGRVFNSEADPDDLPPPSASATSSTPISDARAHHLPWDLHCDRKTTILSKPWISASNSDLDDLTAQTWKVFATLNNPPFLFRSDGALCRIESSDDGTPVPVGVDTARMQFTLVELIEWRRYNRKGKYTVGRPPYGLAAHLVADPDPPVPTLHRIVTAPIFAASGQLLERPNDYADGIIHLPPRSFHLRAFPAHPTAQGIEAAVAFISHHLFADFQFTSAAEKANWFAAVITPFVREMIDGPTPLFWVDKAKGGSGGTLLSSVIAAPFLGAAPSGVTAATDEAEWMRVILSTLRRSPNVFFIDNCNDYLSSAALASAITSRRYEGRIIGSSNNESAEVRCLWLINGNNLSFGWELARRVVRIRIDPGVENPDQRDSTQFVHPKLLRWVIEHRAEVVYHILVLIKAWQAAGCPGPSFDTPQFGSFESWREVVGGILSVADIPGFLENLAEARGTADQESAKLRTLIAEWKQEHGVTSVSVTDLLDIGREVFELQGEERSVSIQLGKILAAHENQIYAGWYIQRLPQLQGRTRWRLQEADKSR